MSDGTSSASATETKTGDKSASALGGAATDTSKNGTTETAATASKDAQAADKAGGGTDGTKAAEKPPEAVDFSKWEPKLPDGVTMDKALLEEFRPLAKELGLKGEGAQKLVDVWNKAAKASVVAQLKQVEDNRIKSFEALRTDKDIGGAKWDDSLSAARRAIREFGGDELRERLFGLGLDNDPVLVKAFVKAGRKLGEDSVGNTAHKPGTEATDTFEDRVSRTYSTSTTSKEK